MIACENILIKDELSNHKVTYADMVKKASPLNTPGRDESKSSRSVGCSQQPSQQKVKNNKSPMPSDHGRDFKDDSVSVNLQNRFESLSDMTEDRLQNARSKDIADEGGFTQVSRTKRPVITGSVRQSHNARFKGAPEPSRDLFVYRVHTDTGLNDIRSYLQAASINIRGLDCISNAESKFKSFRLTVSIKDNNTLLNEKFWPSGVRIRRFHIKKNY